MEDELISQPFSLDENSSPIDSNLFTLCDADLFGPETLMSGEEASCSQKFCFEENSVITNHSTPQNLMYINTHTDSNNQMLTSNTTTPTTTVHNSNMSILFDSPLEDIENDISASIDFSSFTNNNYNSTQETLDFTLQPQPPPQPLHVPISNTYQNEYFAPFMKNIGIPNCLLEEDGLLSYIPANYSHPSSFPDNTNLASYFSGNFMNTFSNSENFGSFTSADTNVDHLDYQATDNAANYCQDPMMQRLLNTGDFQQLVMGGGSNEGGSCPAPLSSDIASLEESAFKIGKLSAEQRKEKIQRYLKKRNQRNFSKKIKYACRKTLADSRPRVKGRFAKNEEYGDHHHIANNHGDDDYEEDEDDEIHQLVKVKEEDDMIESPEVFSHISGVNSFKCNYSIQSWI